LVIISYDLIVVSATDISISADIPMTSLSPDKINQQIRIPVIGRGKREEGREKRVGSR